MAKCKQKLCQRTKGINNSGDCSVCEEVIRSVKEKHIKVDEKRKIRRVELDIKHMMNINDKLARGEQIDSKVVSNLLLSGVINVIEQHVEEL